MSMMSLCIALQSDTVASPSVLVPGLKILALRVNFRVLREIQMLASFLRCFPNIDTLHIEVSPYSFSQSIIFAMV
jgi:hypothetical protein